VCCVLKHVPCVLCPLHAGASAVMATYPLDLVRTRLAYATEAPPASAQQGEQKLAAVYKQHEQHRMQHEFVWNGMQTSPQSLHSTVLVVQSVAHCLCMLAYITGFSTDLKLLCLPRAVRRCWSLASPPPWHLCPAGDDCQG
jgi:hypothetical protein